MSELPPAPRPEGVDEAIERNARVQARYDELRREGRHGHYETMFRVVREEVDRSLAAKDREITARILEEREACARGNAEWVGFYEREFYPLSNFSAFKVKWQGFEFDTSEAAYHWEKFPDHQEVRNAIRFADSAHEAFKTAERYKALRRQDWDQVRVSIMKAILIEKALQHEYVRRKLLETSDRELVEDSWRDDFWGWGPNRDGQNMLGKLWMEVRSEIRSRTDPRGKDYGKEGSS